MLIAVELLFNLNSNSAEITPHPVTNENGSAQSANQHSAMIPQNPRLLVSQVCYCPNKDTASQERYLSSGGCSNCCESGASRFSGEMSCTPVSTFFSTILPRR